MARTQKTILGVALVLAAVAAVVTLLTVHALPLSLAKARARRTFAKLTPQSRRNLRGRGRRSAKGRRNRGFYRIYQITRRQEVVASSECLNQRRLDTGL